MNAYVQAARLCVKDWKRFLLACVLNILPIINFLVLGYMLEMIRRVEKRQIDSLPQWTSWGRLFLDGLRLFVVCVVWLIPFALFAGVAILVPNPLLMISVFVLSGLIITYLLPSIFVHQSRGTWGGLSREVILWSMSWSYLKAWVILMAISVSLGLISRPLPLLGAALSAYVVIGLALSFGRLE